MFSSIPDSSNFDFPLKFIFKNGGGVSWTYVTNAITERYKEPNETSSASLSFIQIKY